MVLKGKTRLCVGWFDGGSSDVIWWRWCCNWIVCFCWLAVGKIIHPGYVIDETLVDLLSACQLLRRYCTITSSFCNTTLYVAGLNWPWLQLKHCLSKFRMFSGSVQQREWNAGGFSTKPRFPFLIYSFLIWPLVPAYHRLLLDLITLSDTHTHTHTHTHSGTPLDEGLARPSTCVFCVLLAIFQLLGRRLL